MDYTSSAALGFRLVGVHCCSNSAHSTSRRYTGRGRSRRTVVETNGTVHRRLRVETVCAKLLAMEINADELLLQRFCYCIVPSNFISPCSFYFCSNPWYAMMCLPSHPVLQTKQWWRPFRRVKSAVFMFAAQVTDMQGCVLTQGYRIMTHILGISTIYWC